jgi:hypothetical protein
MEPTTEKASRSLWLTAFRQRSVWRRAACLGLSIGVLQAVINQGDLWWRDAVNGVVVAKTIVSPLVTFGVALISAAATQVDKQKQTTL